MSASSSAAASSASFHFSPPTLATTMSSPLHSPISPLDPTHDLAAASPPRSLSHSPHHPFDSDLVTPLFGGSSTSSSPRPPLSGRANSYATHHQNNTAYAHESDDASERQRGVSYAGHTFPAASNLLRDDDALASTSSSAAGIWAVGAGTGQGAAARSAEDQYQGRTGTARTFGSGSSTSGQGDAAQQHQQMHHQQQLARPPFLPSVSAFSHQSMSKPLSSPPLPSPPPLAPQMASLQAHAHEAHQAQVQANDPRASPSLHLGDLDVWMDEAYVRECCARMGWDGVSSVKMIRGTRCGFSSGRPPFEGATWRAERADECLLCFTVHHQDTASSRSRPSTTPLKSSRGSTRHRQRSCRAPRGRSSSTGGPASQVCSLAGRASTASLWAISGEKSVKRSWS